MLKKVQAVHNNINNDTRITCSSFHKINGKVLGKNSSDIEAKL